MTKQPKILFLDIETAPNTAYVWALFDQNIAHDHLVETSYILCWSARWDHSTNIIYRECRDKEDEQAYWRIMMDLRDLLDEADIVVHYYGSKFDIPTSNKEFVKLGIAPPSPYAQIDLKLVVAQVFRFESNKLDYVAEKLGFGKKMETQFSLWVDCMHGDEKAWKYMRRYNQHDVVLLHKVYERLLPWIPSHPNVATISGSLGSCPRCGAGADNLTRQGERHTKTCTYQQYRCKACGGWSRARLSEKGRHPDYV